MALTEKQLEQRRNAGKARARQFTPEYQRAGYDALVSKYGKTAAMRILAESISKRPLTNPECELLGILYGMGLDVHTSYIVETQDGAWAVDAYIESAHLVIQVDGEYWHGMDGRAERDYHIDQKMALAGYRVIRFTATQVTEMPDFVHKVVEWEVSH